MKVVSDTTAITTLLKAGQVCLLRELFEKVFVPQAVWAELMAFHSELPDFVELRAVSDVSQRLPGTETLGRGEAEALLLAKELNARLLVTDDRKARLAARRWVIWCSRSTRNAAISTTTIDATRLKASIPKSGSSIPGRKKPMMIRNTPPKIVNKFPWREIKRRNFAD